MVTKTIARQVADDTAPRTTDTAPRTTILGKPLRVIGATLQIAVYLMVWVMVWLMLLTVLAGWVPGWTTVVITSDSMGPHIRRGDVLIASEQDPSTLGPGTVVLFQDADSSGLTTHRIVGINPDGSYRTQGDANSQPDSTWLDPAQVIGVGQGLVPFIGRPVIWFWEGQWHLIAGGLLAVLLALMAGRRSLIDPVGGRDSDSIDGYRFPPGSLGAGHAQP